MKQFIAFVKKEFYHIFRDRRTMLILLGMPVVQIILFGFAISTEVKNVRLAVLDPSNDVVTRKIIDRLDASEYFTVTTRFHSPQEMETAFRKNKIDMAIVFGERFADGLYTGDARVQLIVDTAGFMTLSTDDFQTACCLCFFIQLDIRTTACHVASQCVRFAFDSRCQIAV